MTLMTVFYDGSCALCSAEMAQIQRLDRGGEIGFVDCAAADFDAGAWATEGVSRAQMLQALHVRDVLGDWHRGVDAIALLYATVGAPWLARAWAHPLTRPFTRRLYPFVVRHRHRLAAFGLHLMAPRVLQAFARRRPTCEHDRCRSAADAWAPARPNL